VIGVFLSIAILVRVCLAMIICCSVICKGSDGTEERYIMLFCVVQRVLPIVDIAQTVAPVCAIRVIMVSDLQQIAAKVRQFLIHDLLFLPISTIESRVS